MDFMDFPPVESNWTNFTNESNSCSTDDEKGWMEIMKVALDAFVTPILIIFGTVANLASFIILGKISLKIRKMIKPDQRLEDGTLITILLLRVLAVLDTIGMLLLPLPEACMLLYNMFHSGELKHLYYNPPHSIFPHLLIWTIPGGMAFQTMLFWVVCILAILRLSLRCCSGSPPCCIRSTRRVACFIVLVCLVSLATQATSFHWYKVEYLRRPCSEHEATMALVSEGDGSFAVWLARVISYALADALPFVTLSVVVFGLFITLCVKRPDVDTNERVVNWDERLHLVTIIISFITMLTVGLTSLIAVFDVCRSCHPTMEKIDVTFQVNWWAVLVAEFLLVILQSMKVVLYLLFLKPFRQICACKSDEVGYENVQDPFEFNKYSNTKL